MGIYRSYLDAKLSPTALDAERKKQLGRIGQILKSDVLTYAARLGAVPLQLPLAIHYEDLLPFHDLLSGLKQKRIAVILETPGGSGEVARDMVDSLHQKFEHVTFIVPGTAKSAGTIMVLGGHEILMGPESSLGPIDAQVLQTGGKVFSADALLEGFDRVKREVDKSGKLNAAYIPILQQISPGEIQGALNALEFARATVRDWLVKYKFANWTKHSSTGKPVTPDEKETRAYEISSALSSQTRWHTHGRSIRIPDLVALRLQITDYSKNNELADAIRRYYTLLRMTFDAGSNFKILETPAESIARQFQQTMAVLPGQSPGQLLGGGQTASGLLELQCGKCQRKSLIQLDFEPGLPLQSGAIRYPDSGILPCPGCKSKLDMRPARMDFEKKAGRPALSPQPKS